MQSSIIHCGQAKVAHKEERYSCIAAKGELAAIFNLFFFAQSVISPLHAYILFCQENPEDGGWHDLVAKGFIEYIDTEEEETTMISMTINVSSALRRNADVMFEAI